MPPAAELSLPDCLREWGVRSGRQCRIAGCSWSTHVAMPVAVTRVPGSTKTVRLDPSASFHIDAWVRREKRGQPAPTGQRHR